MAVTTGYKYQGTDIGSLYGAKGATTVANTGFKVNNADLSTLLLALADGKALGFNTSYTQAGSDLSSKFGQPTGNTPLPINGQSFSASSQSGTQTSVANLTFSTNNSTWTISGTASPSGNVSPTQSGSIPTGATAVKFATTTNGQAGTGVVNNGAPSNTNLTGTQLSLNLHASSTPSTGDNNIQVSAVITYYNSSGTAISTTSINMYVDATGSA